MLIIPFIRMEDDISIDVKALYTKRFNSVEKEVHNKVICPHVKLQSECLGTDLLHRNEPVLRKSTALLIIQPLTWLRREEFFFFLLFNRFGREIRKEVASYSR